VGAGNAWLSIKSWLQAAPIHGMPIPDPSAAPRSGLPGAQYILPNTLMESFDAYREEAYKEAIRSIAPTTVAWFLDMLNRYRGLEDRKESLLEVFDPRMFTVNHPAWQTPPETAIDLPSYV
jgi:hypothetical protein